MRRYGRPGVTIPELAWKTPPSGKVVTAYNTIKEQETLHENQRSSR